MRKILIIEDEVQYSQLLHDQLAKHGYSILVARDGKDGLALAKTEQPDLILLDIQLPIMNGLAMLQELRKDVYGKDAKVIVLTNLEPDDKVIKQIIADRPSFYCVKSDIQFANLLERIHNLLQNPFSRHE